MSSDTSDRSEPVPGSAKKVPGWSPEVGTRIAHVIEQIGGLTRASEILEIKAETIANWRDGRSRAPLFSMQMLVDRAGTNLDWLLTGRPEAPQEIADRGAPIAQAIDVEFMGTAGELVETLYRQEGARPSARELVQVSGRLYSEACRVGSNPAERLGALKLLIEQERATLRAAAANPTKSKSSA